MTTLADDDIESSKTVSAQDAEHVGEGDMHWFSISLLTAYFTVLYGGLIYIQIVLWHDAADQLQDRMTITFFGISSAPMTISGTTWVLLLILTTGALGSFIHAATSLADYVGNLTARRSWLVWFLLRPLIGSCLAFIFYFILRGGLFTATTDGKSLNLYGFAAIAGLAGMFSKQATDKMREVFDSLFKSSRGYGDDARKDKLKKESALGTPRE